MRHSCLSAAAAAAITLLAAPAAWAGPNDEQFEGGGAAYSLTLEYSRVGYSGLSTWNLATETPAGASVGLPIIEAKVDTADQWGAMLQGPLVSAGRWQLAYSHANGSASEAVTRPAGGALDFNLLLLHAAPFSGVGTVSGIPLGNSYAVSADLRQTYNVDQLRLSLFPKDWSFDCPDQGWRGGFGARLSYDRAREEGQGMATFSAGVTTISNTTDYALTNQFTSVSLLFNAAHPLSSDLGFHFDASLGAGYQSNRADLQQVVACPTCAASLQSFTQSEGLNENRISWVAGLEAGLDFNINDRARIGLVLGAEWRSKVATQVTPGNAAEQPAGYQLHDQWSRYASLQMTYGF